MAKMFHENKLSKVSEIAIYAILGMFFYFNMKEAKIQPWGYSVMLLGFILFLVPKVSVIRKGIKFSFGCDHMSSRMMWLYFISHIVMVTGYFLTFPLW